MSSNIGYNSDYPQSLQFSFTSDFNVRKYLYSGSEQFDDGQRKRTIQSCIIQGAHAFSNRMSFKTTMPLVLQTRKICSINENIDFQPSFGIGEPVILIVYDVIKGSFNWRIGLGPQILLGRTNLLSNRILFLIADLEPVSHAWDAILISYSSITFYSQPTNKYPIPECDICPTGVNNDSRDGLQTQFIGYWFSRGTFYTNIDLY